MIGYMWQDQSAPAIHHMRHIRCSLSEVAAWDSRLFPNQAIHLMSLRRTQSTFMIQQPPASVCSDKVGRSWLPCAPLFALWCSYAVIRCGLFITYRLVESTRVAWLQERQTLLPIRTNADMGQGRGSRESYYPRQFVRVHLRGCTIRAAAPRLKRVSRDTASRHSCLIDGGDDEWREEGQIWFTGLFSSEPITVKN